MEGGLEYYLSVSALEKAAFLYLVTLIFFYIGLSSNLRRVPHSRRDRLYYTWVGAERKKLFYFGVIFGFLALLAYWYMISNVGGFLVAYSRVKGGGYAESGYIAEATLLSFPAVLLLAISRRGSRRIGWNAICLALLFASPHLIQGTFGGRRGPLFLVLCLLFFSWHIAIDVQLSMKRTVVTMCAIVFLVIVVWSQRHEVHLGSEGEFESERIWDTVAPEAVGPGNTYLYGVLAITTSDYFEEYYWGYRYFVTLIVRPIPKQIWPTKYQDMGADWLFRDAREERAAKHLEAANFVSTAGAAIPAIADAYLEFSWGAVILFYLTGRFFEFAWRRKIERGGVWEILYYVMLMLGIYLAAQSFFAWLHRLLVIGVPTFLVWRYWIESSNAEKRRLATEREIAVAE